MNRKNLKNPREFMKVSTNRHIDVDPTYQRSTNHEIRERPNEIVNRNAKVSEAMKTSEDNHSPKLIIDLEFIY